MPDSDAKVKELRVHRKLLGYTALLYFVWWFAVEALLPGDFNPLGSRLVVVACPLLILGFSYRSAWIRHHLRTLFAVCAGLLTLHYFYLFHGNQGRADWIIGSYITVMAAQLCILSNRALQIYSVLVVCVAVFLAFLLPSLRSSIFIPGLLTIVLQAHLGLRSRLRVLKILADSNERFRLLFNSTFEGILVHEEGRILNVNHSLNEMLGFLPGELLGRDVLSIVPPEERDFIRKKIFVDEAVPYETRCIGKNGQTVEVEVRGRKCIYDRRPAKLVTILAIGDRKLVEKEKVASMALAENLRARDEFISIASHELKTPLSSLKLQTMMLEREVRRGDPSHVISAERMGEFLALMDRQTNRLIELVETMLDVSRISAGKLSLNFESVDLVSLIRVTVNDMKTLLQNAQSLEMRAAESVWISADPNRIEQVIENLISNAIKYGNGKPIRIEVFTENSQAVVRITDQGLGIDPDRIGRIFDRFERAISARHITGLGLGLYITRQILEAHGASISVESQLHVGSIFTVRFPIEPK